MRILAVGCSSGSGLHFAQKASGNGHDLITVSRTKPSCHVYHHLECDLMNQTCVQETINKILDMSPVGGYDGAVFYQRGRDHPKINQWQNEIQVGLTATREFVRNVLWSPDASIVVVGSIAGSHAAVYEQDDGYHVSKAGMLALVRYYALHYGIRINMVTPGEIIKMGAEEWRDNHAEQNQFCESVIPLGRIGDSQDITEVVMFLLESGKYITGQEIVVDGGLSAIGQGSLMHKMGKEE